MQDTKPHLILRAPAKVNLFLAVLEGLADGYHRVETVLQAVSLYDELTLAPAPGISIVCDDPAIPTDERNLCHRAALLFMGRVAGASPKQGVAITLRKRIPAQAGLGGGSSDAAATLVGLNRLWGLGLPRRELCELAAALGADVPFFIHGGLALGTDRGDRIERLAAGPVLHLVIARIGPGVSTAWAYARCKPAGDEGASAIMLDALATRSPRAIALALRNDLEPGVLAERRDIADLKQRLLREGALGALMAGSGSAVFGIFPTRRAAQETAVRLCNTGIWAQAVRSIGGAVAFLRQG